MTLRSAAIGAFAMLGLVAADRAVVIGTRAQADLSSLYIALHAFSDDLPAGYEELLDVTPAGDRDVRVRIIRLSLADRYCPAPLVRAIDRIVPRSTVATLVGSHPCAVTPDDAERALSAAPPKVARTVTETASQTIVATCGREQRVFTFPWPEKVDRARLGRSAPEIESLWRTYFRVQERAFGKNFSLSAGEPARQSALESAGAALVPDLLSGKYQAAFDGWTCRGEPGDDCHGNYLAWYLRGYRGVPAQRGMLPPELVDAPVLRFVTYRPPEFPAIALAARVTGDVRLRLSVDADSGVVKSAEVLSGNALLTKAATTAAASWQLEPGSLPSGTADVTLRFQVRCLQ